MCAGCIVRRDEARGPHVRGAWRLHGSPGLGVSPPDTGMLGPELLRGFWVKRRGDRACVRPGRRRLWGKRQWDAQIGDPLWGVSLLEQGQPSCWKQGDAEVKGWGPGTQVGWSLNPASARTRQRN